MIGYLPGELAYMNGKSDQGKVERICDVCKRAFMGYAISDPPVCGVCKAAKATRDYRANGKKAKHVWEPLPGMMDALKAKSGMNNHQLEKVIKTGEGAWSKWTLKTIRISQRNLDKICEYFGMSREQIAVEYAQDAPCEHKAGMMEKTKEVK
jgi:hypothetical protein